MFLKPGRTALLLAAAAQLMLLLPYSGDAHAQRGDRYNPQWSRDYRDHDRDARDRRERERRHEAKTTGVVVGVVGAAVVAGVIAAAAKRERETPERADYCIRRYGNYDRRSDTYRGADCYTYPCHSKEEASVVPEIAKYFAGLDTDGDGFLSLKEMQQAMVAAQTADAPTK